MTTVIRFAKRLRHQIRSRYLEAGEAGWGHPQPQPSRVAGLSADRTYRVAIVGAGGQGLAQCRGIQEVKGIEIAGLADHDAAQLARTAAQAGVPASACFDDVGAMLAHAGPFDLVSVATTAPSHVTIGRQVVAAGVRRLLLEKPIDTSLADARAFRAECEAAGVVLSVNYSRRWMLEYRAIKRALERNVIGDPRLIVVAVGKGDLAMIGSHYFDLCRFLLDSEPVQVLSYLDTPSSVNTRGADFVDPHGHCHFTFANGARAYIDFSADLMAKDPFVLIKGTLGRITIDEPRLTWTLQSRSQRLWTFPFSEPFHAATIFARVVADVLSRDVPAGSGHDGVAALEMIIAAHLSSRRENRPVRFPIGDDEAAIGVQFP